jgi:hypothetical protein
MERLLEKNIAYKLISKRHLTEGNNDSYDVLGTIEGEGRQRSFAGPYDA